MRLALVLLAPALAILAGCASPGVAHLYQIRTGAIAVTNSAPSEPATAATPAAVTVLWPGQEVVGLACDKNTDHLYLRLAPGNLIRVARRASGRYFRYLRLPPEANSAAPADLGVRSSDRHLFLIVDNGAALLETNVRGEIVQRHPLPAELSPASGLAVEQSSGRLWLLIGSLHPEVVQLARSGEIATRRALDHAVQPGSLAHDETTGHFFAPLADGAHVGEFDSEGRLVRQHAAPAGDSTLVIDVAERSFARVF